MAPSQPTSHYVDATAVRLHSLRWGGGGNGRPTVLLLHGTAFCAATWRAVAGELAGDFSVLAVDRRGHGRSAKPASGYEFRDFANDLIRLIDALGIREAYGVGHSAGGTDLLLASAARPHAFTRLFVMEPTVVDPRTVVPLSPGVHAQAAKILRMLQRRRTTFPNRQALLDRYTTAPAFARWRPDLLAAYVDDGFETLSDGRVQIRCTPDIEQQMLRPITYAMLNAYHGDALGNPFETLSSVACPVMVSASTHSESVYRPFVETAARLLPRADLCTFSDTGHCVPQENPGALVEAVRAFWQSA